MRRWSFSSNLRMKNREYFDISDPFGIYFRIILFRFSTPPFSQAEYRWQKYILILNFCSSRLWWINNRSLSKVIVRSSGNRFLIRPIARSTAGIDTGHIFSRKGALAFRSVQTNRSPSPVLPEAIKSPSASPIRFLSLIYLGLLSIIRRSLILNTAFFLPRLFGYILFRWASTLLPYTLLIYVRIVTPDT